MRGMPEIMVGRILMLGSRSAPDDEQTCKLEYHAAMLSRQSSLLFSS